MKVRIIKTDEGYIPQAFFDPWHSRKKNDTPAEPKWYFIGGSQITYWSSWDHAMYYCTYSYLWRAKMILKKFLKDNKEYSTKYDKFLDQLKNPHVVYEAEV